MQKKIELLGYGASCLVVVLGWLAYFKKATPVLVGVERKVPRIRAVCEGGPMDGKVFSQPVDADVARWVCADSGRTVARYAMAFRTNRRGAWVFAFQEIEQPLVKQLEVPSGDWSGEIYN